MNSVTIHPEVSKVALHLNIQYKFLLDVIISMSKSLGAHWLTRVTLCR